MPAARQRARSADQSSGRNKSPSKRQWKSPVAYPKWTVTMQCSVLPTVPHHCRCTPGVLSPRFTSLVSSMTPIDFGPECSRITISCKRFRVVSVAEKFDVMSVCP
jgi:hypothetical protein